jgi:hypothetical protein
MIRYNLACCACQLHQLKIARTWLEQAIKVANCIEIKAMAREDPDLEPLWNELEEIGATEADLTEAVKS